jgi:phosphatidylglycerophosphatase A
MSTRTDVPSSEVPTAIATPSAGGTRKPNVAVAIATVCGVGYIPFGPGTWGSAVGVALYWLLGSRIVLSAYGTFFGVHGVSSVIAWLLTAAIALVGVWAAGRTATFLRTKDPGCVVIDEVSGQLLTYAAALAPVNWKYLLLGFILFRAFDIWKPFPARQAESLPGGLGIMADDWMAAIYAAIGLWIARAAGF